MGRRVVQVGSVVVAIAALAVVLYNATLVDRRPPSVTAIALSAPAGGDGRVGQTQTAIDVEFSEPVRTSTVEQRFHIDPFVAGTFTWDGATLIYTPSGKLPPDTPFTVTVDAGFADLAGNVAGTGLDPWQFRTVGPPGVTAADPADGTTDVAVTTQIRLTFDRLMDTASVEAAMTLTPAIPYHASWSGETVTLTPDEPLAFGTDYTLTVGAGARDTGGTPLREPFDVGFRTVAASLGVAATVPASNVSGISVRTLIAVVFDGPIDPSSVTGALRITPTVGGDLRVLALPDDHEVAALPSASPSASSPGGRVLLLTPSAPLAAHTTYTVELAPVVRGSGGDGGVAAGRSWSFTTGGPTTSAQNQIAFLSARSGFQNVWLMNPDGSNQRQLTSELAPVTSFDVSATGDQLAFAAGGLVKVATVDGGTVRTLTQPGSLEYAPTFGPQARFVFLARRSTDGTDEGWWEVPLEAGAGPERQLLPTGAPPLGSVDLEVGRLTSADLAAGWGRRALPSADGRRLLVVGPDGTPTLVDLAATDALPPQRVDLVAASAPAWDRSAGTFLVVGAASATGTPGVWRISLDGRPVRVVDGIGSASASVDGAIATVTAAGRHVGYVAPHGSDARPLTTSPGLVDGMPSFAPDGSSILFLRAQPGQPERPAGIWLVAPDGTDLRQLATDGADPRWLP
ncbi:MAG TPA: Ig-like domain-containing protein [Candidatus Limnocylindrales bacterium]|nr:Ig-like domain-containing protein [Candidatus Limnocylindrales bacterium]